MRLRAVALLRQAPDCHIGSGLPLRPVRGLYRPFAWAGAGSAPARRSVVQTPPMKIEKNTAVTLRYRVTDASRKVLEEGSDPMVYLHGGYGNTFAKIEHALEGQEKGFQTVVELQPQDAFGERDESLLQTIAKKDFPPGVKVGGTLRGHDGQGRERVFTVLRIKGDKVMLDGNHPMAGKAMRFALTVADVRAATPVEIEHGHVHGPHGHHH